MMKTFSKITAIAAALTLATAGVVGASANTQSAPDSDLCVIAVWKDDPTITAKSGNCPIEAAPEDTVEEPAGKQVIHHFIGPVGFMEPYPVGPVRLTVVNQVTGRVAFDETKSFEHGGGFEVIDHFVHPASDPIPTYLFTLTADGKTYTRVSEGSSFYDAGDWDGLQGYVAEDSRWLKDGKWLTYDEVK